MVRWTKETLDELFAKAGMTGQRPEIAIETGTFKANSTIALSPCFKVWHTIDIDPKFIEAAKVRCAELGLTNIGYHIGDSRRVLPKLVRKFANVPVCFFLDAHFSRTGLDKHTGKPLVEHHVGADFPLFDELTVVGDRTHPDVVVVDDWGLAGKEPAGCRAPGDSSEQWASLNLAAVLKLLKGNVKQFPLLGTMVFYRVI